MSDQNPQNDPYAPPPSTPAGSGDPYAAPQSAPYAQSTPYSAGASGQPAKSPILSILSLIAGILGVVGGLVVFWIPIFGPILQLWLPAAAVVLGFLGKKKEPQASKGLWLTGIITGFVGLLLFVIGIVITIAVFSAIGTGSYTTY